MQKIWVCGARGQIGQAVNDVVDKLEFEMLDTDVDDLDVTDTDEVLRFGEMNRPVHYHQLFRYDGYQFL